jgi:hypothetical protein
LGIAGKTEKEEPARYSQIRGFPSPSYGGFGFIIDENDFVRLPSGISLREAKVRILEIGPLHNFLAKGVK